MIFDLITTHPSNPTSTHKPLSQKFHLGFLSGKFSWWVPAGHEEGVWMLKRGCLLSVKNWFLSGPILLGHKIFGPKTLGHKSFLTQIFFGPQMFLDPKFICLLKFVWAKNLFGPKIFLTQLFYHTFFWTPLFFFHLNDFLANISWPKFFWLTILLTKNFLVQNFVRHKILRLQFFLTQHIFRCRISWSQIFLQLIFSHKKSFWTENYLDLVPKVTFDQKKCWRKSFGSKKFQTKFFGYQMSN